MKVRAQSLPKVAVRTRKKARMSMAAETAGPGLHTGAEITMVRTMIPSRTRVSRCGTSW
jgi:hypothetical protein